jgi:hypothetical protein
VLSEAQNSHSKGLTGNIFQTKYLERSKSKKRTEKSLPPAAIQWAIDRANTRRCSAGSTTRLLLKLALFQV